MSDTLVNPTRIVTASITRPANTDNYTAGDAMGAGSAANDCIMEFANALPANAKSGKVVGARLAKDDTGVTNDAFRLLLFRKTPDTDPDENAAPSTSWIKWADRAAYVGMIDFQIADVHSDAVFYEGQDFVPGGGIPFHSDGSQNALFGILTALAAYNPASAEVFHVQLEISIVGQR